MLLRSVAGQPVLIGPLLAVADGAEQTSGAAIAVRKDGVAVGAAGGVLVHVAAAVWQYTPAQSETDCAMLGLILTKASAVAVSMNVPTTRFPTQTPGVLPAVAAGASAGLVLVGSGGGIPTAAEVSAQVWADAPDGTPVEDVAAAVWAGAPAGTPTEDIADAVWADADKVGYSLAPTGLDAIPMTLTAAPSNFRGWLVWLILRFRKVTRDKTTGSLRVYGSDTTTVVTTQATTDTTTEQTTGAPT